MNTKGKISINESKMKTPTSTLMRAAGVSAMAAGLGFIVVGLFHPVNVPSSVITAAWVNVHIVAIVMGFFGLFGMAGLYARQAENVGWLGLVGFVLFSIWLGLIMPFSFVEAFILPQLATELPAYVEGFLGMFTGIASQIDLGILPTLWELSGPMFIIGPLLFGIATFRARVSVLLRWTGGLLAVGSALIPAGAFLPPEYEPLVMVPVGLALASSGYALFSERREKAAALSPVASARPEPSQAA